MQVTGDWFVDKHFKVLQPLELYSAVDDDNRPIGYVRTLQPGEIVAIDSYLFKINNTNNGSFGANGVLWLSIYDIGSKKSYYFQQVPGTLEELKNYSGDMPADHFQVDIIDSGKLSDIIFQVLKPVAKWGVILYLGSAAIKQIFKSK